MPTHEIIRTKDQLPVYFIIDRTYNLLVPSHWHNHIEVLYLYKGIFHMIRNEEKYTLHPGDLFVVNSGDIHFTHSPGNLELLLLQIPYDLVSQSIPKHQNVHFKEYFSHQECGNDVSFHQLIGKLDAMRSLYENSEEGYQFLFSSHLYEFLHTLYIHYSDSGSSDERTKAARHISRLKEVINYVELHYREPITLQEVADLVALNPEYFCRSFKKYTGLTFNQYVNFLRLTHVHQDLLTSEESITRIQERHGFTNYKVFNRMFKETYGCTPSVLRSKGAS